MTTRAFRWGIFGTGAISAKFVAGLVATRQPQEVVFVASRTLARAQQFVAGVRCGRPVEGYAAAAALGGVDAIYIATPPSVHAEHALACIEAGIPVLIEKPMAVRTADARRIADAARTRSVFAMEAMWTRFLPAAAAMRALVMEGRLGEIRTVSGDFGMSQRPESRNGMFDPQLGGGAMAHLGAYPLSLGQWLFGTPSEVQALAAMGETGVDETVTVQCRYPGNVLGSFHVSLRSWSEDRFLVSGTEGSVGFRGSIVRPHGLHVAIEGTRGYDEARFSWRDRLRQDGRVHRLAQLLDRSGRSRGQALRQHYAGNGYHYEVDEVQACVGRGDIESEVMPLDDSVNVAATADRVRAAFQAARSGPEPR